MSKLTEKSIKIARTAILYLSFFALGLCASVIGPTLLDLQNNVGADTKHIAFIYSSRSGGFLVGSLLGGVLFDLLSKKQPLLICSILTMSACSLAIPWCRSLITLIVLMAAGGIAMGILNTGGNVWCLNIWNKEGAPFFQALHFSYGFGGFVGPLIAAPFLRKYIFTEDDKDYFNSTRNSSTELSEHQYVSFSPWNSSDILKSEDFLNEDNHVIPSITYAYTIISSFTFLVAVLLLWIFITAPKEEPSDDKTKTETIKPPGLLFTVVIAFLASTLTCLFTGSEIAYVQMIPSYAVKGPLKLSKSTGSYLASLYWGTFTLARGISIFLLFKLNTLTLIVSDLSLCVLAGALLLTFAKSSLTWLWAGTGLLGFAIASAIPAVISWMERYIVVNSKIASTVTITASLGEMVMPTVISLYLDTRPELFFYIIMAPIIVCCFVTFIMWILVSRQGEKYVIEERAATIANNENTCRENSKC